MKALVGVFFIVTLLPPARPFGQMQRRKGKFAIRRVFKLLQSSNVEEKEMTRGWVLFIYLAGWTVAHEKLPKFCRGSDDTANVRLFFRLSFFMIKFNSDAQNSVCDDVRKTQTLIIQLCFTTLCSPISS